MQTLKTLTFKNGQFILIEDSTTRSVSLKEASRLKRFADEFALKVFDRTLLKTYPLPSSPGCASLPSFLDPHQIDGVCWVLSRSRSYLVHAPGAGKTLQAITASLYALGDGHTVFIVPPSLTVNWQREINRWVPLITPNWKYTIAAVSDSSHKDGVNWEADFLIVPDSMLTKPWVLTPLLKMKKKLIAVDEASRFKEATAERTKALFGGKLKSGLISTGLIQDVRHAVLLDGSPMPNRPMELWAPTYAMAPETIGFMDQSEFGFRYCGPTMGPRGHWEFKRSSNEEELKLRLQNNFMHIVSEDVLEHPERRRSLLFMSRDERDASHKSWEKKNLSRISLSSLSEDSSQGDIATFRRLLGIRKVNWVGHYVKDRLLTKGESILLFAWHREVCEGLAKQLSKFNPGLILGGTDPLERENHIRRFQEGETRLLIGNILALGRGHNLQKADRVVFAEFSWTDETNLQAEKRASRKGRDQHMPVRVDYVVNPNSMDEVILNAVFTKAKSVKRVIG